MKLDENKRPDYGDEGPIGEYIEVLVSDWDEMMSQLEYYRDELLKLKGAVKDVK